MRDGDSEGADPRLICHCTAGCWWLATAEDQRCDRCRRQGHPVVDTAAADKRRKALA